MLPSASLQRSEAESRRALLEMESVAIDLAIDEATTGDLARSGATFGSVTTLRFTSQAGSTFLNVEPVELNRVRLDGADLPVERLDRGRFPLDLGAGVHELVVEATMRFRSDGEGLHLAHDPADGQHYVYGMSFMDAAPSWFACFDQPDLKAAYSVQVRAPRSWTVIGNAPAVEEEPGRWRWGPTPPISTYLVTLAAGPWHLVRDEHDGIGLGLSARASLAQVLDRDAEDLLTVTRQSFDDLHARFGIRYPFGEYHQAFVPEFNAGAMENPGCVLHRDGYLSTSRLTRGDLAGRASTVAHELTHQWFGNLVTPRWWDDLWLNESFAEYLGNRVVAESTQYAEIWVDDIHARRQWGLVADQRPTTHPVAGTGAVDARAALQDFDGISYAKGASLLRQLAARVGDEVFFGGVVDHLERHRFDNATMLDLVDSWQQAGANLSTFVTPWLRTAGPDRLELDRDAGVVRRTAPVAHPAERSHAIDVAVRTADGWRRDRLVVEADATPYPVGAEPVLLDPDCLTWAVTLVDPVTVAALQVELPAMSDPMLRASTWNSLRNAFHNALLDPADALDLVIASLPTEDPADSGRRTASWVHRSVIALQADPAAARMRVHEAALDRLTRADAGSEDQLGAFRMAVSTAGDAVRLRAWLADGGLPGGLVTDVDVRWRLLRRLAELGETDDDELDAALADDPSTDASISHTRARASLPTAAAKAWAWERFTAAAEASNHEVTAAGAGLWQLGQEAVTAPYVDRFFVDLPGTVGVRAGWSLADAAAAFYPWTSRSAQTVERTEVLAADKTLELSLRRVLADLADEQRRMRAVEGRTSW